MRNISFRDYLKSRGYRATKIWKTSEAFYANVYTTPRSVDGFTNVDFDSKMVRLSFKDTDNEKIVGRDTKVVYENTSKLSDMLEDIIGGEEEEETTEEATVTGNVDGYNTPHAFGKPSDEKEKAKRMADIVGYTQVNEDKLIKSKNEGIIIREGVNFKNGDYEFTSDNGYAKLKYKGKVIADGDFDRDADSYFMHHSSYQGSKGFEDGNAVIKYFKDKKIVNEGTNRYHQLRKDEGTPNQKIGKGIREMRNQIQEMEKFLEWYGKIKTENDLDSTQYWKRTQKHLNVIRERLTKISQKIQNLSV